MTRNVAHVEVDRLDDDSLINERGGVATCIEFVSCEIVAHGESKGMAGMFPLLRLWNTLRAFGSIGNR